MFLYLSHRNLLPYAPAADAAYKYPRSLKSLGANVCERMKSRLKWSTWGHGVYSRLLGALFRTSSVSRARKRSSEASSLNLLKFSAPWTSNQA